MIRAALELVRVKGPRGFTLNEASRVAGVSVSAPYNHFKDKDALLIEVVLLGNRTLEAELRAAADTTDPPREKLMAVYLSYVSFAERHPDLFAVMFQSGIDKSPYPEVQASSVKAFEVATTLTAQIESSQALAEQLAIAVWTMAHGFATLSLEGAIASAGISNARDLAKALVYRLVCLEPFGLSNSPSVLSPDAQAEELVGGLKTNGATSFGSLRLKKMR